MFVTVSVASLFDTLFASYAPLCPLFAALNDAGPDLFFVLFGFPFPCFFPILRAVVSPYFVCLFLALHCARNALRSSRTAFFQYAPFCECVS